MEKLPRGAEVDVQNEESLSVKEFASDVSDDEESCCIKVDCDLLG